MNPNTGHLVDLDRNSTMSPPLDAYIDIPPELSRAARRKLAGKSEAMVSLTSGGKLSNWAKEKRKKKAADASKRRNRKN